MSQPLLRSDLCHLFSCSKVIKNSSSYTRIEADDPCKPDKISLKKVLEEGQSTCDRKMRISIRNSKHELQKMVTSADKAAELLEKKNKI